MENEKVPMVTSYIGRKVSDKDYGSMDAGIWLSLPLGADLSMVEAAIAQGEMQLDASKPIILKKVRRNDQN